jgi:NAD(P)-dependent dehydrogenase (short-subunit alcohol dehydrogenase family)
VQTRHTSSADAAGRGGQYLLAGGRAGGDGNTAYGASKAGLLHLTQTAATQYGKQGVRCNAIAPGMVVTPPVLRHYPEDFRELFLAQHLTPELGRPEDIAAAALFLASDEEVFITGQVLPVDGGLFVYLPWVPPVRRRAEERQ